MTKYVLNGCNVNYPIGVSGREDAIRRCSAHARSHKTVATLYCSTDGGKWHRVAVADPSGGLTTDPAQAPAQAAPADMDSTEALADPEAPVPPAPPPPQDSVSSMTLEQPED